MTPPPRLLDPSGHPVALGPLLASGGEGSVFPLAHKPPSAKTVAKVCSWVAFKNSPYRRELNRRRRARASAMRRLRIVEGEWDDAVQAYEDEHRSLGHRVSELVAQDRGLGSAHAAELADLGRRAEQLARDQHLRHHFISDATIPNIGDGRKQVLAAYNVLTAFDVDPVRIQQIQGFGPGLTNHLVVWRNEVLGRFRFDRSKGVPEPDLRALAANYRKQQEAICREIEQRLAELEGLDPAARTRFAAIEPDLRDAVAGWVGAEADLALMRERE